MSLHSSFRKWLHTPATLKRVTGVDAYGKTLFGDPISINVFATPVTTEQLSVLAIKEPVSHQVIAEVEVAMNDYLSVEGVVGKTPRQVRPAKDHKGDFSHVTILL